MSMHVELKQVGCNSFQPHPSPLRIDCVLRYQSVVSYSYS